jgi:hypothetical protein
MGGFMWALRWLAAASIFANCIAMTVEAELASHGTDPARYKPLIAQNEVKSPQPCTTARADFH